jgi:16S rRNA (cytosine967-C5)-methyltransferase
MKTARFAACATLDAILRGRRGLDDLVEASDLDSRDRAFARLLAATTLRRLGQIDALIGGALATPLPPRAHKVQDVLRLGVAQLLFLDTPPHAAVDTAVDLARTLGLNAHVKLVNAVLRRLAREGRDQLAGQDAARLNTPDWLWDSWCAAYGEDTARRIAAAHLAEAPLDITARDDAPSLAAALEAEILPTGTLRRSTGGAVETLPGFAEGSWWVQDMAAALPARLFGPLAGRTIADLCAAPGGKTLQLAAAGASVWALDRSEARLDRLRQNLERVRLTAEVIVADAADWQPPHPLDGVLLDAPCSATGTTRRHPDAPWTKGPGDVAKLAAAQDRLLHAAVDMVAPGGLIVFCTCSLQPEEGPARVDALLTAGAPVVRRPIHPDEIGGLTPLITADGDLRSLPCHLAEKGGMDGFFAARLEKR